MNREANLLIDSTLGNNFILHQRKKIGAAHSGHGVVFGEYIDSEVAVKPYYGKNAVQRAKYEERMYRIVRQLGFRTLEPFAVLEGEGGAVLLTHYLKGIVGLSGLTLDAGGKTELGREAAQAVTCTVSTLAKMHHVNTTHGDPQGKNWGFKVVEMTVDADEEPVAFDLEKATQHSRSSKFRESAIKRDLQAFTFTLGSRGFGGTSHNAARSLFFDTVLEPYAETRLETGDCVDQLGPIVEFALDNFERTRENYQRPDARAPSF